MWPVLIEAFTRASRDARDRSDSAAKRRIQELMESCLSLEPEQQWQVLQELNDLAAGRRAHRFTGVAQ